MAPMIIFEVTAPAYILGALSWFRLLRECFAGRTGGNAGSIGPFRNTLHLSFVNRSDGGRGNARGGFGADLCKLLREAFGSIGIGAAIFTASMGVPSFGPLQVRLFDAWGL